jgi:hypothetical protein
MKAKTPERTLSSWLFYCFPNDGRTWRKPTGLIGKVSNYVFLLCWALVSGTTVFAAAIVTNCTEADLRAALTQSGDVVFGCSGTLTLTGTVLISTDTRISANGHPVTLDGGNVVRLFQVDTNTTLVLEGLSLANGAAIGADGINGDQPTPGGDGFGGGILNLGGSVALVGCTLTNQIARGGHGGQSPMFLPLQPGGRGFGGAICNLGGTVNLTNCVLAGNAACGGTGTEVYVSPPHGGDPGPGWGGALYSEGGTVRLESVILMNNSCLGGKLMGDWGGEGSGGALYVRNSEVLVNNSLCISNQAVGGSQQSLVGGISGAGLGGALLIPEDSACALQLCSFSCNLAQGGTGGPSGDGGFAFGGVGLGGAVFNEGRVNACDSTFSGNGASGGAPSGPPPAVGQGGAIYSTNELEISRCTFAGNSALGGDQSHRSYWPGATGDGGAIWSSGALGATNSTIANNAAAGGSVATPITGAAGSTGGGVCVAGGTAMLLNMTIAGNRADPWKAQPGTGSGAYGGGLINTNGTLSIRNSIIANSGYGGEVSGTVIDGGYNICSDNTASFSAIGSYNNTNPLLGPLSNNGGPTATMVLLPGGPSRDVIPSGFFPPIDQRGVARPQGPAGDIGAVEGDTINVPFLLSIRPLGNSVGITLTADPGRSYCLLASSNLVDWSPVATNSAMNGGSLLFNPSLGTNSRCFFRVVTP